MMLPWQWTVAVQSDIEISFREQVHLVASQLAVDFVQFSQRAPVKDSFFFVAFISLMMWIISLTAGYLLIRRDNLLAAVIPSAVVIDDRSSLRQSFRAPLMVAGSISIPGFAFDRTQIFSAQPHPVEKTHVAISEDAWPEYSKWPDRRYDRFVFFVAWIFPTSLSSLQSASDMWNNISNPVRNRLSNAVTSLQSPYSNGGTNFYSESLPLGLTAAEGNQPVFTVKVLSSSNSTTPYYWRGTCCMIFILMDSGAIPAQLPSTLNRRAKI